MRTFLLLDQDQNIVGYVVQELDIDVDHASMQGLGAYEIPDTHRIEFLGVDRGFQVSPISDSNTPPIAIVGKITPEVTTKIPPKQKPSDPPSA